MLLSAQMVGLRFTAAAQAAGVESRITAHSGRVGLASELTSLHQMLRVLQLNLFDRRPLAELFTTPSPPGSPDPQMLLWR